MLIVLLLCLFTILIYSLHKSKNILITPQIGFSACFFVSVAYSIFYADIWELNIAIETFLTILGGVILFVCTSLLVKRMNERLRTKNSVVLAETNVERRSSLIYIEGWKLMVFAVIQIFILLLLVRFFNNLSSGSLSTAIYYYRHSNLFTDNHIDMPEWLIKARNFCMASGYLWVYILLNNYIYKYRKRRFLLIINIALSIAIGIILGGRGSAISIIVAALVQFYIITGSKNEWNKKLDIKKIVKLVCFALVLLLVFEASTVWLGRTTKYNFGEYIAIYLSAEIKNLDIFIRKNMFGSDISGWQTLIYFVNFLSRHGFPKNWYHKLDIPFNSINGHGLGNVATTFYAFLYDGGFIAVVIFTVIMAILCQIFFEKAIRNCEKYKGRINMNIIIYSYVYFTIIFSFFSNKFYEMLVNPNFIYTLIFWYIIRFFVERIRIK